MQHPLALVNGELLAAQPGLSGTCPTCGDRMVAKCGPERVWHWSHPGNGDCDRWGEPETEWHRVWKGQFPREWQEVVHHDAMTGEVHRADVTTESGLVIEFQHSYLKPDERQARNEFYPKMLWVVDTTKERAAAQLLKAWEHGLEVGGNSLRKVLLNDCALLRRWAGVVPIFFDVGETHDLLWLIPSSTDGWAYLGKFPRAQFIESLRTGADQVFEDFPKRLVHYESLQALARQVSTRPLHGPLLPRRGRPRPRL